MFIKRFHVLQNEAGAGNEGGAGGAGAAGAAAGAGVDQAGAGGSDAAGAGTGAAGSNVLSTGAGADAAAAGASGPGAAAAAGVEPGIPEKFVVKGADGKEDFQATALKLAREGYLPLEKRLGGGDAPPKTAEGYKVNVPEALAEKIKAEDLAKDEGFKGFLSKLHAAGASQKVVDAAVSEMLERGVKLRETMPVLDAVEAEATLRQSDGWKSDAEYTRQVRAAFQAGKQYAGPDFDGIMKDYGNDPRVVRMLANVGAELTEDTQASPEAQTQLQESLDTLMASKAYLNERDPQHSQVFAKVSALQTKLAGTQPVATGRSMSFKTG